MDQGDLDKRRLGYFLNSRKPGTRPPYPKDGVDACSLISKMNTPQLAARVRRRRFTLAGGEFAAATGEARIDLTKNALEDYGKIPKIDEVITDHGTQIFANKTDKKKVNLSMSLLLS
jgi:hypothetical protein